MKELKNLIRLALILAAVVLLALLFAGCAETDKTVSIEDRIRMFENDLNTDAERDDIWENLHPDIRDPFKIPSAWDGEFVYSYKPFSLSVSITEPTASGTMGNYTGPHPIVMYFQEDDGDWYISHIDLDGAQVIPKP